jgi:sodium-dependent dicarboxylate transporter 2/3/5
MSTFWITEAIPVAITSLLPIVLFPLFGILSSSAVAVGYFKVIIYSKFHFDYINAFSFLKDINMMFFGGLVVAISIETSGLHERIALRVLMNFGSNPKWLMLGFMVISSFLSLWINNTAALSMMLPVVFAVLEQLIKYDSTYHKNSSNIGIYTG